MDHPCLKRVSPESAAVVPAPAPSAAQRTPSRANCWNAVEKIAEGEQWRDKWRKASADGVADRTEIERLQNALEARLLRPAFEPHAPR